MSRLRREIAARNRDAVKEFKRQVRERTRASVKTEPPNPTYSFDEIASFARHYLDGAKPYVEKARALMERTKDRKTKGELSDREACAELLPAQAVLLLSDVLEQLHQKAFESKSRLFIMRVRTAADTFRCHLDENLLREETYPKTDEALTGSLIKKRESSARDMYENVLEALDGVQKKLGVNIPLLFHRLE